MNIVCSQKELAGALGLVSRAVSSRPSHPVLGNVLLCAESGFLTLTGFDLAIGLRTRILADVETAGAITVPAKLFNDIVSRLPDGDMTLALTEEETEGCTVEITSTSGRFNVRGLAASEFPALPTVDGTNTLTIPVAAFEEGLRGTLYAASTDETKQVLTGVHIKAGEDGLEFAATDGHRLATANVIGESGFQAFEATIPARALRELERTIAGAGADAVVSLATDDSLVIFEVGDRLLTSRKLDGAYPAYQQLIPRQFVHAVTVDRKQLLTALDRVSVLADQKNNLVKILCDADGGRLKLSVEAQDVGIGEDTVNAQITGSKGEYAFNIKYLVDALKSLPSQEIKIELNHSNQPVILTPLGAGRFLGLIMPVQIVR